MRGSTKTGLEISIKLTEQSGQVVKKELAEGSHVTRRDGEAILEGRDFL